MLKLLFTPAVLLLLSTLVSASSLESHRAFGLDSSDEESMSSLLDIATPQSRELGTVLIAIKKQFKEILDDIMFKALEHVEGVVRNLKTVLLSKLKHFSLANIFQFICDCISNIFFETSEDIVENTVISAPERPFHIYRNPYVY